MAQHRFFHDTFTEAVNTLLSAHTPDLGDGWTSVHTNELERIHILASADRIQPTAADASSGEVLTADVTYPSANYQLRIFAVQPSTLSDDYLRLYVRFTAFGADGYYAVDLNTASGRDPQIARATGPSSETDLVLHDNTIWPIFGATEEVIMQCYGDEIAVFNNDEVAHLFVVDTNITGAGKAAIGMGHHPAGTGGDMDPNEQIVDDFELWNLSENEAGWQAPTTTGEIANQFTNPANAYAVGAPRATHAGGDTDVGNEQDYGDFGFSVPHNAVINGLSVKIGSLTDTSGYHEYGISISKDNGRTWSTEKIVRFEDNDASIGTKIAGHARSLWGMQLTGAHMVNDKFKVKVRLAAVEGTLVDDMQLDHIAVKVYYDTPTLGWFDSNWANRIKITIDHTEVDAPLTDFPVYLKLNDLPAGFHAGVNQTDARDVRITMGDGITEVPREVVGYGPDDDEGDVHFRAPGISDTVDTEFYIYYNNPSATDHAVTDPMGRNAVWINGYVGVWHLQGAATPVDATGNAADATTHQGTVTSGKFLAATNYTPNQRTIIPHNSALALTDEVTWSMWLYGDSFGTTSRAFEKSDSYFMIPFAGAGDMGPLVKPNNDVANMGSLSLQTWYHLAGRFEWNGSAGVLDAIKNGVIQATTSGIAADLDEVGGDVYIGSDDTTNFFDGRLNEIRIAALKREIEWLAAEHSNQNNTLNFYSLGSQESESGVAPVLTVTGNGNQADLSWQYS